MVSRLILLSISVLAADIVDDVDVIAQTDTELQNCFYKTNLLPISRSVFIKDPITLKLIDQFLFSLMSLLEVVKSPRSE